MATIKSFTDISQSKKLAEILPLETADMHYWGKGQILGVGHSKEMQEGFESKGIDYTPCWSLAALLDLIPLPFNSYLCNHISQHVDKTWACSNYPNGKLLRVEGFDNPVDACYEMILKLYERKML